MVSRPMARADLVNQIEDSLQDSTNSIFTAAEVGLKLDDALIEASHYVPYVTKDIYTIESRTGSASSTSANNLVDASKSPFLSTDTNKVVYNVTDKTWAVIKSYSSASQVGLSADIFTSGEQYEIYNKGCWNSKQLSIINSDDWLWIIAVEYPALRSPYTRGQTLRNYTMMPGRINLASSGAQERDKIIEMDVAYVDDSGVATADKDAYIWFARQHRLNPMTDLLGAVNNGAGYAAGSTSMVLGSLQSSGTVPKDTLFTVALATGISSRLVYRVTADATITTSAATISFWPGLEAAVVDTAVVTFVGSTLTPELERVLIQLTAGRCSMSKSIKYINSIAVGGGSAYTNYREWGEREVAQAIRKLKALEDPELRAYIPYGRN